jgi:peptidoglycan/LPS O-acetylase OafA/YrhL
MEARTSAHLDALRALAAIAVMAGHARALLLLDFGATSRSPLLAGFYALTGLGHQAVLVFFALSGLLVGGSVLRGGQQFAWREYAVARFTRLFPVLLLAQVSCALLDFGGIWLFGGSGPYGGNFLGASIGPSPAIVDRMQISSFLGSLAFLPDHLVLSFGSNFVLWSLVCEFWYYILFPLIITAARPGKPRVVRAVAIAFSAAILLMLGLTNTLYFFVWVGGAAVSALPLASGRPSRVVAALAYPLFAAAVAVSRLPAVPAVAADVAISAGTLLLLWGLRHLAGNPPRTTRFWSFVASFSYTLYAVHLPLLIFVTAGLERSARWEPSLRSFALYGSVCCLAVAYAFVLANVAEYRSPALRRWLLSVVGTPARYSVQPGGIP